ncbi:hypothetical protein RUM43_005156 [Polyplax serrata]|uniref:Ig-like domain-containing protein n=1 Tax=Polyplax serrata TaxID=468196 RepID=A0AAN8XPF3_POLSC
MDQSRHKSYSGHSRTCDNKQCEVIGNAQRLQHVDAKHQRSKKRGQGTVYVPSQYGSNEKSATLHMSITESNLTLFQTAFLEVVIPPDIIYEETSGDLMVPEGGSAKLVCKARGHPKPKVIWRREDGGDIIVRGGTATKTRMSSVEGEMLTLSKVTRSEMGAYLCIAANGVPPSVSKRMMLHVHLNSILIFVDVRENVFCELKLEKTITIKK